MDSTPAPNTPEAPKNTLYLPDHVVDELKAKIDGSEVVKPIHEPILDIKPEPIPPNIEIDNENHRIVKTPEGLLRTLSRFDQTNIHTLLESAEEEQVPPKKLTAKEGFNVVSEAVPTIVVGDSNLISESEDANRVSEDYESAEPQNLRYPIPTFQALYTDKEHPEPISKGQHRWERFWSSVAVLSEEVDQSRYKRSVRNKKAMELLQELMSTGDDSQIRKLFSTEVSPGVWESIHEPVSGKVDKNGIKRRESVSASLVKEARKFWMNDVSSFAAAFWYELNKSTSEQQFSKTIQKGMELINEARSRSLMRIEGLPFIDGDVIGLLKGVGFIHAAEHLSLKHADWGLNDRGEFAYRGISAIPYLQELSTRKKPHEIAMYSPIDVANLAKITDIALNTSIEFKDQPQSQEFKESQYLLQRAAYIVSNLRYPMPGGQEDEKGNLQPGSSRMSQEQQLRNSLLGNRAKPAVSIDKDGKVTLETQQIRTGSASMSTAMWEQIAQRTDVASYLFPNIKYIKREDYSTLDETIKSAKEGEIQKNNGLLITEQRRKEIERRTIGVAPKGTYTKPPSYREKQRAKKDYGRRLRREKKAARKRRR